MTNIRIPQITLLASDHPKQARSSTLGPFFTPNILWAPNHEKSLNLVHWVIRDGDYVVKKWVYEIAGAIAIRVGSIDVHWFTACIVFLIFSGGLAGSGWARAFGRLGGPPSPYLCFHAGSTSWELFSHLLHSKHLLKPKLGLNSKIGVEVLRFAGISSQKWTRHRSPQASDTKMGSAMKYLAERYDLTKIPMAGASGGALAAVLAACGVKADDAIELAYKMRCALAARLL
eukprot:1146110-Pelagomonas_calceolata.AAC.16